MRQNPNKGIVLHELMKPRTLEKEDFELMEQILEDEDFRGTVIAEIGKPVQVHCYPNKGFLKFISPKKTKIVQIETLLAYAREEVH